MYIVVSAAQQLIIYPLNKKMISVVGYHFFYYIILYKSFHNQFGYIIQHHFRKHLQSLMNIIDYHYIYNYELCILNNYKDLVHRKHYQLNSHRYIYLRIIHSMYQIQYLNFSQQRLYGQQNKYFLCYENNYLRYNKFFALKSLLLNK